MLKEVQFLRPLAYQISVSLIFINGVVLKLYAYSISHETIILEFANPRESVLKHVSLLKSLWTAFVILRELIYSQLCRIMCSQI